MRELGSLLGRWHQWRHAWSHERSYARTSLARYAPDTDDMFELLVMESVEREVELMPRELQLALQHVARAECLGVEVVFTPRLCDANEREPLVARALVALQHRLTLAGVL